MAQDKEKGRLEENRSKVIERTKAIIEQAGKMRNAPVGTESCSPKYLYSGTLHCSLPPSRKSRMQSPPISSALHDLIQSWDD